MTLLEVVAPTADSQLQPTEIGNTMNAIALFRTSCLTAAITALAACGSTSGLANLGAYETGTHIAQAQMDAIKDRGNRQADVVAAVGQPNRKAQVGAKEVWYYDYTHIGHAVLGGTNINESSVFEFNASGLLLTHYKANGTGGTSSNALVKAAGG
jgi:hypothetical protein